MVATERIKRAETEEELHEIRMEKDALREALRLIEGENGLLRSANVTSGAPSDHTEQASSSMAPSSDPTVKVTLSPPSPEKHSHEMHDAAPGVDPTSYTGDLPDHLKGFTLGPAPKVFTLRRTQLPEISVGNPAESACVDDCLPAVSFFSASSVAVIPDEPSPWGDSNVST